MRDKAPYEILFKDAHHLVVNKAAGVGCLSDRYDLGRVSLLELLRRDFPSAVLVHRIDLETSGLVLAALSTEAMRWLSAQFEERRVKKEYIAFVSGFAAFGELTVNRPVDKPQKKYESGSDAPGFGTEKSRSAPEAVTSFRLLRNYRGFAKIHCLPKTGRLHQIRIHLSGLGLPVVCDSKYGGVTPMLSKIKKGYFKAAGREEVPLLKRLALHAWKICYTPFGEDEARTQEAPLPRDLSSFEGKLERFA